MSDVAPPRADPAAVYGSPPAELTVAPAGAVQTSPLIPGSEQLEALAAGSLDRFVVYAPPATVERRAVLALALRALKPGGELLALAPKEKGGSRLGDELRAFGCEIEETGRRHHRICLTRRPGEPIGVDAAIAAGAPRELAAAGGWTQPGVFSWDRPDPGTDLLIGALPALSGAGADLGCGVGRLMAAVLASARVTRLEGLDIDRRAVDCALLNIVDPRASIRWADVRGGPGGEGDLDFVVMNPPFHEGGGGENRALGQEFIRAAHTRLRRGGALWLVANRHLPYEAVLGELFKTVAVRKEASGFKVFEARR